jgi:hypothetical protein
MGRWDERNALPMKKIKTTEEEGSKILNRVTKQDIL